MPKHARYPTGSLQLPSDSLRLLSTVTTRSLSDLVMALHPIEGVQRLKSGRLVERNPSLPPPGKCNTEIVVDEFPCGYTENVVELFKCSLFRLWQPQEDHTERNHIQAGVETDGSCRTHRRQHEWERD
jgi:hypothetical protein